MFSGENQTRNGHCVPGANWRYGIRNDKARKGIRGLESPSYVDVPTFGHARTVGYGQSHMAEAEEAKHYKDNKDVEKLRDG